MKRRLHEIAALFVSVLFLAQPAMGLGGKVTSPDGKPAAGAKVHVDLDGVEKFRTETDASGRFQLPSDAFLNAMIQIKAPHGKDFASVALPVSLFESGDVAIVLQPKK